MRHEGLHQGRARAPSDLSGRERLAWRPWGEQLDLLRHPPGRLPMRPHQPRFDFAVNDVYGECAARWSLHYREPISENLLRRVVARVGAQCHGADQGRLKVVWVGDAAACNWTLADQLYPDAVQVLDWHHAVEHAMECAKVLPGPGRICLPASPSCP